MSRIVHDTLSLVSVTGFVWMMCSVAHLVG